jgi:hypothetical protein
MYLPSNIIALSKSNCTCKSGANPEWDLPPVFDIAITDNVNFDAIVDSSDCTSVWNLLNEVRKSAILEFETNFKLRFLDFARKIKAVPNAPTFENQIELIEKVENNVFYNLAAECVQLLSTAKLYEKIINSSEISRMTMIDRDGAKEARRDFFNRYKVALEKLCEKIPKKGIWRELYSGSFKEHYR